MPLEELELWLAELPAEAEVVAYCRGPYCVYAHEAVRSLRKAGHRSRGPIGASSLQGSIPGNKAPAKPGSAQSIRPGMRTCVPIECRR